MAIDVEDLAVMTLCAEPGGEPALPCLSAVELGDCLGMGAETMADRITLLSTLSNLEEVGLVEHRSGEAGSREYQLTAKGQERAQELYEKVLDRSIEVRNGKREEISLADVDAYLPAPAIPRALARMTDDGVLYLQEEVETTFVDREDELACLEDRLEETRDGSGGAAIVVGEAGVGKTTLIEHFLDAAVDTRILEGTVQTDTDEPYEVIRDAIEPIVEQSPFDRPTVDLTDDGDLEQMRLALFADVADRLIEYARAGGDEGTKGEDGPVVLVIEDLHNVDDASIDLLHFLSNRIVSEPILLLASTWTVPEEATGRLADLIDQLGEDPSNEVFTLAPFDRQSTRELIESILGTRPVPATFAENVYEHTGGNGLFVAETLAALQDSKAVVPEHDVYPETIDQDAVPGRVELAIERRLDVLDDDGREVLATAALLGEVFPVDTLAGAVDLDAPALREYLDLLVDVGVLRWEASGSDRLSFASGLFRQTITERMPTTKRRDRHRRIAERLSESNSGGFNDGEFDEGAFDEGAFYEGAFYEGAFDEGAFDEGNFEGIGTVAYHFEQAGMNELALFAWLRAAEQAESMYAQEIAAEQYERALHLARELSIGESLVLEILESMGDIALLLAEADRARRAFEYIRESTDLRATAMRASRKLALCDLRLVQDPERARDTINAALDLVYYQFRRETDEPGGDEPGANVTNEADIDRFEIEETEMREVCELLVMRARASAQLGNFDETEADLEEAMAIADVLDDRLLRAAAMSELVGHTGLQQLEGVDEEIATLGEHAVDILEGSDDVWRLKETVNHLGIVYSQLGEIEKSDRLSQRALELSEQIGDRYGAQENHYNVVTSWVIRALNGDQSATEAIDELGVVIEEAEKLESDVLIGMALWYRSLCQAYCRYDVQSAIDDLEEAIEYLQQGDRIWRAGGAAVTLAWICVETNRHERAESALATGMELCEDSDWKPFISLGHRIRGDLALADGCLDEAREAYERAVTVAREADHRQMEVVARAGLVESMGADGQADASANETVQEYVQWLRDEFRDNVAELEREGHLQSWFKPTLQGRYAMGRYERRRGKFETARQDFEWGLDRSKEYEDRLWETRFRLERAMVEYRTEQDSITSGDLSTALNRLANLGEFEVILQNEYEPVLGVVSGDGSGR